jgi:THO complex subunit 7
MAQREDQEINDAIVSRLLHNEGPLNSCLEKFITFSDIILDGEDAEQSTTVFNELVRELEQYQYSHERTSLISAACLREAKNYQKSFGETENEINVVKQDIVSLKQELEKQKVIRKNKEEYDAIAKLINELPSRETLQKELDKVSKELSLIESESAVVNSKLDLRTKQFQLLLYSINELERELNMEEQFDREQQLRELLMQQTQQIDLPMDELRPDSDVASNPDAGALNDDRPSEEGAIEDEKMEVNKEETTTGENTTTEQGQSDTAQPSSTADVEMKEAPAQ